MKKLVLIVAVLLVAMTVLKAVPEYEDLKIFMDKQIKMFEVFGKKCEAATDGKSAAEALTGFTNDLKIMIPEIKAISAKYKNMEDMKVNPPAELAPQIKKIEEVSLKMQSDMGKLMQYASDPVFLKALQELQTLSLQMSKLEEAEKEAGKTE